MIVDDLKNGIEVVLNPDKCTKAKMSVGDALVMYYKFSVIPLVLSVILAAISGFILGTAVAGSFGGIGGTGIAVILTVGVMADLLIGLPIFMLVISLILYAIGKLLSMFNGTYANTFTGVVYSEFPSVAVVWLSFIPVLGSIIAFLAMLYGIWVFVNAEANQNKTTKVNAFLVGLFTAIIVGIVMVVVIALVGITLLSALHQASTA